MAYDTGNRKELCRIRFRFVLFCWEFMKDPAIPLKRKELGPMVPEKLM